MSLLWKMSHRSSVFSKYYRGSESLLRELMTSLMSMNVFIFDKGGASLQFL